jgi:hypothetical protein
MDVQLSIDPMNPQPVDAGKGNLAGAGHYHEVARFHTFNQPSDVDVDVALGMQSFGVISDTPLIAPSFPCLGDGGAPQNCANFRGKGGHLMHARRMLARQCEHAIGLSRAIVLHEEKEDSWGLMLGQLAQGARRRLQRFGSVHVAGTGDFGAREAI